MVPTVSAFSSTMRAGWDGRRSVAVLLAAEKPEGPAAAGD
jgi:hypothetical protein